MSAFVLSIASATGVQPRAFTFDTQRFDCS